MGALAIKFDEGERWDVIIDVDGLTAQQLALYKPRIEVRTFPHKTIVLEYSTELTISGTSILWMILPTDTLNKCGDYQWQLMLELISDSTYIMKFPADKFTVVGAIVQQEVVIP